ncbi:MAG: hypothetical protein R2712_22170 [Vicinamibacterales bacterium]
MITVVNIIPNALSGETNQDSEPNIAVNPANANQIAISAFTPDPMGGANAPVFVSTNGGTSWVLNSIVPSQAGSGTGTGDIVPRFGSAGNRFYAGILRRPGNLRLNILRSTNFASPTAMTVLVDRNQVDQPFVQAMTVPSGPGAGNDRVYVGLNDFAAPSGRTATVERSLNAGGTSPGFTSVRIETRSTGTAGQNGPQIRPAVHADGTVYAVFYGWRSFSSGGQVTTDVVVVRDDNWGSGSTPFTALTDPGDGLSGRRVATGVQFTWNGTLGQERLGGDLSIAVDPTNSSVLYIAFCDVQAGAYTIHVRRSTDRGATWSADLRTITNAKNPALAINSTGRVGFAYQRVTGAGASSRWEARLELTSDAFTTVTAHVLADVPATTPAPTFLPYIGDYMHMMAVGPAFYGVFSANNTPDPSNFPEGVTFLRNHDFTTGRLLAVDGVTEVPASIDPFFFKHSEVAVTRLTRFTALTRFTRLTHLTNLTRLTRLTRLTPLTRLTRLTPLTRLTRFTDFTRLTRLTPITRFTSLTRFTQLTRLTALTRFTGFPPEVTRFPGPGPDPGPMMGTAVTPFVRFGNAIFAPEDLALTRFEELAGAAGELQAAGFEGLHQIVTADPYDVAEATGYSLAEAAELIELAQHLMRNARR